MKKLCKTLFILIIFFCNSYLFSNDNQTRIDIFYFHATIRCHTCLTIEDFIKKSVWMSFEKELKDSTILLASLDFLQPENEQFQEKYNFDTQTLIVSRKVNGIEIKWKNLDKIWDYVNDFEKFKDYIVNEIKLYQRD
ncbi:MAG: hypothetical protein HZB41_14325 [Ignavibacteriae bacterium]|nr:hypothetical protein [Ignavibacteriota bacterium]